jgi:hypothetical protein
MAKAAIPDPLKRRHLIEQELSEAQCLAIVDAYAAEGRAVESVQFLAKAGAEERLLELAEEAIRGGDTFLLKHVCEALGREFSAERWGELATHAEASGRIRYAETARRQALVGES